MPLVATRGAASVQGFGEFAQGAAPVYIEDVFSTWLYTGNGTSQTITNGIDLAGKGGLVWLKARNQAYDNTLIDTARGNTNNLTSNSTSAQYSVSPGYITFGSSGFTLPNSGNIVNDTGLTMASWTFRKQPKFFDVVTFTTNSAGGASVPHALSTTPGCVLIKRTGASQNWYVWHRSVGNQDYLNLNLTNAKTNWGADWISPSATNLNIQDGLLSVSSAYVAYIFAHNAGGFGLSGTENVISCGSFTSDGAGAATINLGYEPQWLLVKRSDATSGWLIIDNMRGFPVAGTASQYLFANATTAENGTLNFNITNTGFFYDGAASSSWVYIAIRRGPMKTPTTGTSVFSPQTVAQTGTPDSTNVPFAPDLVTTFSRNGTDRTSNFNQFQIADRLRSLGIPDNSYSSSKEGRSLVTSSTSSEYSATIPNGQSYIQLKADGINITRGGGWNDAAYGNWIYYFMRRAPGFFDEVCWTGDQGSPSQQIVKNVPHNLGVAPELIITKIRNDAVNWFVYHKNLASGYFLRLNLTGGQVTSSTDGPFPASATYTNTTFGTAGVNNYSAYNYVGYLFATCPGVSKVGGYTGTGTTLQIDCGFTAGARFVLIKRTDSTGDWYIWDSARGIVAGNDPYLLLNSTAAEVTNTDYVDTYSAGFEISSTAPAAINANGGTFIFLAIA